MGNTLARDPKRLLILAEFSFKILTIISAFLFCFVWGGGWLLVHSFPNIMS